jgi:quercetin dioxygenase-like cupin family protein
MFISHRDEIEKKTISGDAVKHVQKQVLIGPGQGWDDYVMRMFTLGSEGHTPKHSHPWPHIIYVVEGNGTLEYEGEEFELRPGSTSYVTGGHEHQLRNAGSDQFVFICIVPKEGDA